MKSSPYYELFGDGFLGRPTDSEPMTGVPTGDKRVTETARRRATRVIKTRHAKEFNEIMAAEVQFLLASTPEE